MTTPQKRAWFNLAVIALGLAAFLVLDQLVGYYQGCWASFIFGLGGLSPFIGRRTKPDERDLAISRQASRTGFTISYCVFLCGCMGTWFFFFAGKGQDQVSVHLMPLITVLGILAFSATYSLTTLILYGRTVEADHA